MGRLKPKPFSRPTVNLGFTENRMWQNVPAQRLRPGDTVQGVGTLEEVLITHDAAGPCVVLKNVIDHNPQVFPASQLVRAYTAG